MLAALGPCPLAGSQTPLPASLEPPFLPWGAWDVAKPEPSTHWKSFGMSFLVFNPGIHSFGHPSRQAGTGEVLGGESLPLWGTGLTGPKSDICIHLLL
jgi:hypothetical protein